MEFCSKNSLINLHTLSSNSSFANVFLSYSFVLQKALIKTLDTDKPRQTTELVKVEWHKRIELCRVGLRWVGLGWVVLVWFGLI